MKKCFVISPIGKEDSEIRNSADIMLNHVIIPVLNKYNIETIRADQVATTGQITDNIIKLIIESDLVIADLSNLNPNVFYELGIRHAILKPAILIKNKNHDTPFDVNGINIISYDSLVDKKSNLDNQEIRNFKNKITSFLNKYQLEGEIDSEIEIPYWHLLNKAKQSLIRSTMLEGLSETKRELKELTEYIYNNLGNDIEKKTRIDAQYIDGEDRAFSALTEATKRAKNEVRSSRFFPDSVLGNQEYVNAINARVLGSDGKKALKKYYRIIALNNIEKQNDVIHHLNMFKGKSFELHLTRVPNAFELVVIDDTDVFIHFYKEKMVIASTLHIKERGIVWEFKEIYDKMLKTTKQDHIFDCSKITTENLPEEIIKVTSIFTEVFQK